MLRDLVENLLAYAIVFVLFVLPRLVTPMIVLVGFAAGFWLGTYVSGP